MITFGSRIPGNLQTRLKNILGIANHGGGGKYLGLPEEFGRKKKEMFNYIIDKVRQPTSGWSAKFLSQAGKEILIKSVGISKRVFSMSCFKLPTQVTDEIISLLKKFWWEKCDRNRGIPWVAWKRLQYSKKEGGFGFKDLTHFNNALFAKQAWCLPRHPNNLFARLMKARYYKNTTILDARNRVNQSYGWKSIFEGLNLLRKGITNIIGNGETTCIFKDNWMPTIPPRRELHGGINEHLLVKDLHTNTPGTRHWNFKKVNEILHEDDARLLDKLYVTQTDKSDRVLWCYDKSGEYTVKSGYWIAFQE